MAKKKKSDKHIPEELLEKIRVTPEQTEEVRSKLPYTIIPLDDDKPKKKGHLWCCYCGDWKKFKSKDGSYHKCVSCGISDQDFHVKKENGMFKLKKR